MPNIQFKVPIKLYDLLLQVQMVGREAERDWDENSCSKMFNGPIPYDTPNLNNVLRRNESPRGT
jgi:hypothetical protein